MWLIKTKILWIGMNQALLFSKNNCDKDGVGALSRDVSSISYQRVTKMSLFLYLFIYLFIYFLFFFIFFLGGGLFQISLTSKKIVKVMTSKWGEIL